MVDKQHEFYCSKPWRELSYKIKVDRGGECERCGWQAVSNDDWSGLIGHHKIELTDDNVDDASVSLNPNNVEIICLRCHNSEHRRFGGQHHVYIVWGSPLSGKTTTVREMSRYGDLILDIDALWQAITMQPKYVKPNNVRFNVFALRDALLDQIKTRYGQWYDAYIIGGYPDKNERYRLSEMLGAELIYCESTKDECLNRCGDRPDAWRDYVNMWWDEFERTSVDSPHSSQI